MHRACVRCVGMWAPSAADEEAPLCTDVRCKKASLWTVCVCVYVCVCVCVCVCAVRWQLGRRDLAGRLTHSGRPDPRPAPWGRVQCPMVVSSSYMLLSSLEFPAIRPRRVFLLRMLFVLWCFDACASSRAGLLQRDPLNHSSSPEPSSCAGLLQRDPLNLTT